MLYFDHERLLRWPADAHEHFMPLHATDLVEFLLQHPGLGQETPTQFRTFSSLILSMQHHLYRLQHSQLMYGYSPLDPDLEKMLASVPTDTQRDALASQLRCRVQQTLYEANYRLLSRQEIEESLKLASMWGVRMRVRFELQDWLDVYARGSATGIQVHRPWRNYFRKTTQEIPVYSRLAVVFRPKPGHPQKFDSRYVYLRLFKNVPRKDIDMMLPGAGIQMSWLDHSRIVLPSLYAVAITLWRILRNVFLLALFGVFKSVGVVILVILALGFGVKNLFSFRSNMVRRYMLNITQSLYFQSLDNNSGVLLQMLEEAEQQQACEAILTYFVLLITDFRASSIQSINARCGQLLYEATGLVIEFDATRALETLERFGVVRSSPEQWTAVPLTEANVRLNTLWDSWFVNT
jgi:hypothetical protein